MSAFMGGGVLAACLDRVIALPFRRAIAIGALAPLMLGGCSSSFFFAPDMPVPLDAGPADYQKLVANDLGGLKDRASMGPFEISPLRKTRLSQPGDWMVCVRTTAQERPIHFALFMREGRVIERRLAVAFDACVQEQFQPLPGV